MGGADLGRPVCYRCHKPRALCLCDRIQRVANRTAVWIIQHPRERFHPLGTARIASLGLGQVTVRVAFEPTSEPPTGLPSDAALIYPGDDVPQLASLGGAGRPAALVFIDGTWPQAHCIHRDNPWLQTLPRYQLARSAIGRYRIRLAPEAHHLSTIEAIVGALRLVEPETAGLAGLLESFESMIDDQLRFASEIHAGGRRRAGPPRTHQAVPRVFRCEPNRLVVAYGESATRIAGRQRLGRQIVQWTAVRPTSGEVFERFVRPEGATPSERHLDHMGLRREALEQGVSLTALGQAWETFCHPGDVVLTWNQSSLDLLRDGLGWTPKAILLKAVYCNAHPGGRCGTLDQVIEREGLVPTPVAVQGRARRRLARAVALLERLQQIGGAPS
ncbi:MAG: DTW domain-containing protein [Deltaproteobacteria bacterium]|nr:DTW domain-containing protein [Deltaproteobacteria bacterium]